MRDEHGGTRPAQLAAASKTGFDAGSSSPATRRKPTRSRNDAGNERTIVFGMNSTFAVRQFLPETLAAVRKRGLRAVVIAPRQEDSSVATAEFPDVEFRFVTMVREIAPLSDLRALFQILAVLRVIRPAVTNMSTPKMALIGGLAAVLARVPQRVYTIRGLRYETTRSWKRLLLMLCEKMACACAHRVICISRSVRQAIIAEGIAPAEKASLLGDRVSEGITVEQSGGEPVRKLRERLRIPEGIPVIGFVGRLTRDKGIDDLAECFRMLRARGSPVRLLLLGDFETGDPVAPQTARWVRTCPDVCWTGYVPDPRPYYELMDIFVFPTHREGLGRVLLEAAAAGKPVISTRTTGVVDVVLDGVTGMLVPPRDPRALAAAVETLLENPEMARRMGRNGKLLVHSEFDNSIYLDRLARMLEDLARPRPLSLAHS